VTGQRETTRYATVSLRIWGSGDRTQWIVTAAPYGQVVGFLERYPQGWTAMARNQHYAGLWPTKQAAAEVLVKQAGYELELT
jgi:hypothetical protein